MGMYTELLLKCNIRKGEKLNKIREYLKFEGNITLTDTPRSMQIFRGGSYYHHPESIISLEDDYRDGAYLFARFDIKNYDGDIEVFLDWLSDAVDELDEKCVGWYWYEEEDKPTLLIMDGGKIKLDE